MAEVCIVDSHSTGLRSGSLLGVDGLVDGFFYSVCQSSKAMAFEQDYGVTVSNSQSWATFTVFRECAYSGSRDGSGLAPGRADRTLE